MGINNPNSPLAELVARWSPLEKRTSGRLSRSAFPPCSTRWRRIWPLVLNGKPHMISSALCFRKPKRSSKLPMVSVLSILRSILCSWPFEVQFGGRSVVEFGWRRKSSSLTFAIVGFVFRLLICIVVNGIGEMGPLCVQSVLCEFQQELMSKCRSSVVECCIAMNWSHSICDRDDDRRTVSELFGACHGLLVSVVWRTRSRY